MAGASMNDIKSRIKSVNSTMQITKAMELVATSKLRRAKEKVEASRPYYEALGEAVRSVFSAPDTGTSIFKTGTQEAKTLFVVIAGDRGLAGGYNANVFRLTESLSKNKDAIFLPLGKKAVEYYKHRERKILTDEYYNVASTGVGDAFNAADLITAEFKAGNIGEVVLVYTKFASMISQVPTYERLLPITESEKKTNSGAANDPIIECDPEELLEMIIPSYIGGLIYSAICEALASESGARRSSMNAANKNAEEIIESLTLKYNRARQAVITQEITEIVSGAEAL